MLNRPPAGSTTIVTSTSGGLRELPCIRCRNICKSRECTGVPSPRLKKGAHLNNTEETNRGCFSLQVNEEVCAAKQDTRCPMFTSGSKESPRSNGEPHAPCDETG